MLPAKGYLKSINCPFFETCICERPYCHYKHNKKDVRMSTDLISEIVSKAVHKVLQENGADSGASVSASAGVGANNVTYNPTPISQLNKYKNESIIQIKKHIPIQYTPEQPRSFRNIQTNSSPRYVPSLINEESTTKNNDIDVVPNYNDEFIDEFLNDPDIYEDNQNEKKSKKNCDSIDDNNNNNDDDSDESTLDQCKRIFEEYKVPASSTTTKTVKTETNSPLGVATKKRIAYENPNKIEKEKIVKATIKNPALVMADRYKNKIHLKRSPEVNHECPIKSKRIASVPNVSALLNAKKSIDLMIKRSNRCATSSGQSIGKVKRIAHVPELCLADVPTVRHAEKSKLPVNIRSRFLFLIIKECVKLYISKQAAYERALNEEFNCYSKCSAINSYKNTIMLLINRLRKEMNGTMPNILKPSKHHAFEFGESKLYDYFHKWILTDEELFVNGFPRLGALKKGHAIFKGNKIMERIPDNCQQCARCKKIFQINDKGYPAFEEDCIYHPYNRILIKGEAKYSCCQQISLRKGCCICSTHVFEIVNPEKLTGFVSTFDPDPATINDPRSRKIYALDCEMVYTTRGLELARVTVIDNKCEVCYESLVKPLGDILDCNTRFSGLTTDALENVKTKITDVQATLLLMFNSKTILVGHSFESDLKALRLIHNCVIDTSVLFPHKMGPPKKRALRTLASDFLKKIIQNDEAGHDSAEDAVTCMELLIWKLKEELKTR